MQVARFMTRHPVTVAPDAPLEEAIALMEERGFRHLPVVREGELVGLIIDRDVPLGTGGKPVARDGQPRPTRVEEAMRAPAAFVEAGERGPVAATRMVDQRIGALPVIDAGVLSGIVTETNLVGAFRDVCRDPAHADDLDAAVEEVMRSSLVSLELDDEIGEALKQCTDWRVRHIPVFRDDECVGMVADRDIRLAVGRRLVDGKDGGNERVSDLPLTEAPIIEPVEMLSTATSLMMDLRLTALPVGVDGVVMGIVTRTDVLEHYGSVA